MGKPFMGLLAACVAIAMIVGGCGGGDDSTSADLTKAQFLNQGNAICVQGSKEVQKEFEEFAKENDLSEQKEPSDELLGEAVEEILLPQITTQVDELRDLGAPAGEEEKIDKILTAVEEAIEEAEEDPAEAASTSGTIFTKANKLANEYGLDKCGE